jgi:hypothetical protein
VVNARLLLLLEYKESRLKIPYSMIPLQHLCIFTEDDGADWRGGNAPDSYAGGVWFQHRTGHRLSRLRFLVALLSTLRHIHDSSVLPFDAILCRYWQHRTVTLEKEKDLKHDLKIILV